MSSGSRSRATKAIGSNAIQGFTLIELIVTLLVVAILVAIAAPTYRYMVVSNRLTTLANGFVAGINGARLEAVKRNAAVQFCAASNNGTDTLGNFCTGAVGEVWATNPDGTVGPNPVYAAQTLPSDISLSANTALRFSGQGLAASVGGTPLYSGLLLDLSSSSISTKNHRCVYLTTGSTISTCTYTSTTGGCPTNEPTPCQ